MACCNISFVIVLVLFLSGGMTRLINGESVQKSWCVAKPNADETKLKDNIEFGCSKVNCSPIDRGGSCYEPDNYVAQASVVMNLYYQAAGGGSWDCDFGGTGLITTTDPSYGTCHYV
ncbi:Carbohydrate-binding X8 domain superfamily protein [Rhynchospora pubera]|uniref:Carbohydrate-binding X8 domain superfamily protein n=1 Tax=Rhynchospora pubera TaxID=906938 RepID=A0AAV8C1L7_9POAL|nr:Carbohydrate-binding X8 domain superfamily protein [Rhynchospora pubera]